jgi:hypothetical protein
MLALCPRLVTVRSIPQMCWNWFNRMNTRCLACVRACVCDIWQFCAINEILRASHANLMCVIAVNRSGHYVYHQFNIHNSTFCPHSLFMCFVWISEQTAINSLYNINWLVFITETECVYCAVRINPLYSFVMLSGSGTLDFFAWQLYKIAVAVKKGMWAFMCGKQ